MNEYEEIPILFQVTLSLPTSYGKPNFRIYFVIVSLGKECFQVKYKRGIG